MSRLWRGNRLATLRSSPGLGRGLSLRIPPHGLGRGAPRSNPQYDPDQLPESDPLPPLFSMFLLYVFPVQNVPFPAPRRDVTGKRENFLTNRTVDVIVALEKFMDGLLGLGERAALVREACQVVFFEPVENQMGQVRDPALRKTIQRINPFFAASFCLASRNILWGSISFAAPA